MKIFTREYFASFKGVWGHSEKVAKLVLTSIVTQIKANNIIFCISIEEFQS